jgi:hypothetical protein
MRSLIALERPAIEAAYEMTTYRGRGSSGNIEAAIPIDLEKIDPKSER